MVTPARSSPLKVSDILAQKREAPCVILHRGGIIRTDAPECSRRAAELAGELGIDMLELDIQESRDHVPMIFHERSLASVVEATGRVEDYSAKELSKFRFQGTDQHISTLRKHLEICRIYSMGVMFDFKIDVSQSCYDAVRALIIEFHLEESTLNIAMYRRARAALSNVTYHRLTLHQIERIGKGKKVNTASHFWFGWPRFITCEMAAKVQERGVPVVPSINLQHYPRTQSMAQARKDINRMKRAGVVAFQIDSRYASLL